MGFEDNEYLSWYIPRIRGDRTTPAINLHASGMPVPWVRVHDLPDYVYFPLGGSGAGYARTYLNLMDQYHPCYRADEHPPLDRPLTSTEYREARAMAERHGLARLDEAIVWLDQHLNWKPESAWKELGPAIALDRLEAWRHGPALVPRRDYQRRHRPGLCSGNAHAAGSGHQRPGRTGRAAHAAVGHGH